MGETQKEKRGLALTRGRVSLCFSVLSVILVIGCMHDTPEVMRIHQEALPDIVDYNFHIKPLLSDRCYKCHGPDANTREGDFRLDVADDAYKKTTHPDAQGRYIIKAGSLAHSDVYHRITASDQDKLMPPPESNLFLSTYEQALISKWIAQGAIYVPHWSFVTPSAPEVSTYQDSWIGNEIDQFIYTRLEKAGLTPSNISNKATLIRRATLDLTGLPPTPDEIRAFIEDESNDAYTDLLDILMDSPHYGERMALEWLDVARYADTHGYQDDGMRTAWPWRDWVIKAYNDNLPHDDFITWQIAGDLLDNPTEDQLLATCFNRNHPQTQEGGIVDEEYRVEYVADRTNTFGKVFLGLTTECARCHDHKYDPISQKDYYSLYAFFNNNNESGIVPYNGEASPTIFLPTPEARRQLDSVRKSIDALGEQLVSERYIDDFKKWYDQLEKEIPVRSKLGLLADFSFEKEMNSSQRKLNLDQRPHKDRPKNTDPIVAYQNNAKSRPDASPTGPRERKPVLAEGVIGKGVKFIGDGGIRFNRDLDLDRHQPFSVSVWIKPLRDSLAGPIFNNTNGDFEGYRGWLCKLNEDGTLSFQMNHVWPDNAIDIKTDRAIKTDEWTHVSMVYDGSSQASGIRIYMNGTEPEITVLADKLYKSLLFGKNKTNWSNLPFMLGAELRKTIEDVAMDELKVYDRQLSIQEVRAIVRNQSSILKEEYEQTDLVDHYLHSGYNSDYNQVLKDLTDARNKENVITTDEIEVMIMQDRRERRPTYVLDRGMYDRPTVEVYPAVPEVFAGTLSESPKDRLGLAQWLVDDSHPLTSRVAVNRIWKMLFGRGLVATQEDFGSQGHLPSHPELLDFLALKFIEFDWDTKAFIKYVMLSSTYRQSSVASDAARNDDPENMLYSHFPAHRLSAEAIRDNALAASGLLTREIGGPSVYPYQPPGLWKALATRNATEYKQQHGDSLYRRSMYTVWKRSSPPPSMMTFDAPDRYYCVVDRQKTATPLQSLVLMNDVQFLEAARVLAGEMMTQQVYNPITYAYLCLIGRYPDQHELSVTTQQYDAALAILEKDPEKASSWISLGEFKLENMHDEVTLAAHTIVASTIMNFDEFVMKR